MEKERVERHHVNLRVPPELVEAMRRLAREHQRSINGEMIVALREYLERQKQTGARDETAR